jgi:archaellum component FlaC
MQHLLTFKMKVDNHDFDNKIPAIKAMRNLTGKSLREAKELVEQIQSEGEVSVVVDVTLSMTDQLDTLNKLIACGIDIVNESIDESVRILEAVETLVSTAVASKNYKLARSLINLLEDNPNHKIVTKDYT